MMMELGICGGDTLAGTRLPPHYSPLTAKDGGCPSNPRHCCAHGIHLREYGGASQEKAGGGIDHNICP